MFLNHDNLHSGALALLMLLKKPNQLCGFFNHSVSQNNTGALSENTVMCVTPTNALINFEYPVSKLRDWKATLC